MQLVEIEIKKDDDKTVEEVDVLRGREILQRFSGKYGSICLVVRRPGASCLHVVTEAKTCVARFNTDCTTLSSCTCLCTHVPTPCACIC